MKKDLRWLSWPIFSFCIAFLFSGCCISVSCGDNLQFLFKVVDKDTNQDLVFDQGIPLNQIKVFNALGDSLEIIKTEDSPIKFLGVNVFGADSFLLIGYNQHDYKILYKSETKNTKECCPEVRLIMVTSTDAVVEEDKDIHLPTEGFFVYMVKI